MAKQATAAMAASEEVEEALGLKIDTLLIDCEGCAQQMMDQIGPKLRTQINLVLLEADMGNDGGDCQKDCMDYKAFFAFLEECGVEMVDKFNDCDRARHGAPEGTWCGLGVSGQMTSAIRQTHRDWVHGSGSYPTRSLIRLRIRMVG